MAFAVLLQTASPAHPVPLPALLRETEPLCEGEGGKQGNCTASYAMLHCENVGQKGESERTWSLLCIHSKMKTKAFWGRRLGEGCGEQLIVGQLKKLLNIRKQKSETKNTAADQHHTGKKKK